MAYKIFYYLLIILSECKCKCKQTTTVSYFVILWKINKKSSISTNRRNLFVL